MAGPRTQTITPPGAAVAEADPVAAALRGASDLPDELRLKGAYNTEEAS